MEDDWTNTAAEKKELENSLQDTTTIYGDHR